MTTRRSLAGVAALAALLMPTLAAATCARSSLSPDAPMVLVLSGGGAKGAYEAGVAAAFVERGLPIRLVAGSSAGALNAALIAGGPGDGVGGMWRSLKTAPVYSLRASVLFAGFLPGRPTLCCFHAAGP